ncbi:MAG: hypothetical protein O7I42_13715 [Alphaproteobacteria bacterium]|nr:hypothetical protein [Alphaproteobacteria bacterium]
MAADLAWLCVHQVTPMKQCDFRQSVACLARDRALESLATVVPDTSHVRLDRGMPGDGLIDLPSIRRWVEAAGYGGLIEVEIFSQADWWTRDPDVVVQTILQRYGHAF